MSRLSTVSTGSSGLIATFLLRFQLFMLVGSSISSHCLDRQSVLEYSRFNPGELL